MEHLASLNLSGAGIFKFPIPKGGVIRGVYTNNPVTLAYQDNDNIGTLRSNVTEWEPNNGFRPAPVAYLVVTTTAATNLTIRYEA